MGCGVCDARRSSGVACGAAGLCARVRACAGAAEVLVPPNLYIHTHTDKSKLTLTTLKPPL